MGLFSLGDLKSLDYGSYIRVNTYIKPATTSVENQMKKKMETGLDPKP